MSMLNRLNAFALDVEEENGFVTVYGIRTDRLTNDIKRVWGTSKVGRYMFVDTGRSMVKFSSFFALDFEYIIRKLMESKETRTTFNRLMRILTLLHENTWLSKLGHSHPPGIDLSQIKALNVKLLDHQQSFLEYYAKNKPMYSLGGCLLSAEAGGGKTIAAIALAECAKADIVYVVSPKNAVHEVWEQTLNIRMVEKQKVWVSAVSPKLEPDNRWFIFHFEALDRALEMAKHHHGKRVVVILDESHNFNDSKSLRTNRFIDLCKLLKPTDVIWSSGTPIKALGNEAIPLIRTIDPMFTDSAEFCFRKMFGADAKQANDILSNRLGIISYRVPKAVFMTDKPVEHEVSVPMEDADRYTLSHLKTVMQTFVIERMAYYQDNMPKFLAYYDECMRIHVETVITPEAQSALHQYQEYISVFKKHTFDARTMSAMAIYCNKYEKECVHPTLPQQMREGFRDAKSVVKYVDLKVRGECLGRILSRERINCHLDMIPNIDFPDIIETADKKTVVFTSYVEVAIATKAHLEKIGYKPLIVYADTNNNLQEIIRKFEKDPKANPLIATYQSLSTAVPLVMANTLMLLNSPFRHHERVQAISRCFRIGQDKTVHVYSYFLDTHGEANISTRSGDILEWSKEQVNIIMGNKTPFDVSVESLMDIGLPEDVAIGLHTGTTSLPKTANASMQW